MFQFWLEASYKQWGGSGVTATSRATPECRWRVVKSCPKSLRGPLPSLLAHLDWSHLFSQGSPKDLVQHLPSFLSFSGFSPFSSSIFYLKVSLGAWTNYVNLGTLYVLVGFESLCQCFGSWSGLGFHLGSGFISRCSIALGVCGQEEGKGSRSEKENTEQRNGECNSGREIAGEDCQFQGRFQFFTL